MWPRTGLEKREGGTIDNFVTVESVATAVKEKEMVPQLLHIFRKRHNGRLKSLCSESSKSGWGAVFDEDMKSVLCDNWLCIKDLLQYWRKTKSKVIKLRRNRGIETSCNGFFERENPGQQHA